MRAKTTLLLCCVVTMLLAGPALAAETGPVLIAPVFDNTAPAPICSAAKPDLGGGPVTQAACPPAVWQACFQKHGTCTLCFCIGSACECENRCV